jgi:hypothetical protein
MQRHGHFNLLALNQTGQVRMYQATANRIDLALVKHHFTGADAFDVEREDRVAPDSERRIAASSRAARARPHGAAFATINRNRNHSLATRAARIILAATFALVLREL